MITKKILLFINGNILSKIEKSNLKLYIFLRFTIVNGIYKILKFIKYGDKYFFDAISIEINTYCNRRCEYCPNKDYEPKNNFMEDTTFKTIISQLKKINYNGVLSYHFYNEPLFDNRLEYFIEYVKDNLPNAIQILFTNGDILNMDKAKKLIKAGLNKFVITAHGNDSEKNLERLKPIALEMGSKIKLQSSKDLYLSNRGGLLDINKDSNKINSQLKKCLDILTCIIDIKGDVLLCCQDYHKKNVMGNILEEDIKTIWNKENFKKIRKDLLDKNITTLPICKKCLNRDC